MVVLCIRYVPKLYLRVVGFCCGVILVLSRTPVRLTSMKQRQIMRLSQCLWNNPEDYENIGHVNLLHYSDIIMSAMVSKAISHSMVCSTVCSGAGHWKHQNSASLSYVRGIYRWHKRAYHATFSRKTGITQDSMAITFQVTFPIWPPVVNLDFGLSKIPPPF